MRVRLTHSPQNAEMWEADRVPVGEDDRAEGSKRRGQRIPSSPQARPIFRPSRLPFFMHMIAPMMC